MCVWGGNDTQMSVLDTAESDFFPLKPRKINIIPCAPDEKRLNRYYIVLVKSSSFYMKFVLIRESLNIKSIL